MSATTALISASDPIVRVADIPASQRFVFRGITWDRYRELSRIFADRHVRLTYDRGTLEFMTISHEHGFLVGLLVQMVVILAKASGLRRKGCSNMTCDREDLDRGFEPDASFYLTNEPAVRGKTSLDFTVDPPPDLGIEVDSTSLSRNRLPLYAALQVPEVWRYKDDRITILRLQDAATYAKAERSGFVPFLTPAALASFLQRRSEIDEETLLDEFAEWVQRQRSEPAARRTKKKR